MEKNSGRPPSYSLPVLVAPQPSTSVVTVLPRPVLGPHPQSVTCPACGLSILSEVRSEATTKTHLMAVLLCLVWCCCLPYLINSCKSQNHYCPNCSAYLGSFDN